MLVASAPDGRAGGRRSAWTSALVCLPPPGPAPVTEQLGLNEVLPFP